jgi:hypothetical protein
MWLCVLYGNGVIRGYPGEIGHEKPALADAWEANSYARHHCGAEHGRVELRNGVLFW